MKLPAEFPVRCPRVGGATWGRAPVPAKNKAMCISQCDFML